MKGKRLIKHKSDRKTGNANLGKIYLTAKNELSSCYIYLWILDKSLVSDGLPRVSVSDHVHAATI